MQEREGQAEEEEFWGQSEEETNIPLKSYADDVGADEKPVASTKRACRPKAGQYATRVDMQAVEILLDINKRREALALPCQAARRTRSQELADLVQEVAKAADSPFEVVKEMMERISCSAKWPRRRTRTSAWSDATRS